MHVAGGKDGKKDGMGATLSKIVNEEGIGGLYGGMKYHQLSRAALTVIGIGSKVTQSVLTAALLFAFKDALYDASVKLRRTVAAK